MPFDGQNYQTNTTADVLRRARALIDAPEKWNHGFFAYGPNNSRCIGCAIMCADNLRRGLREHMPRWFDVEYIHDLFSRAVGDDMILFNERASTTHADVMAAFDKAIALAEAS